MRLLPFVDDDGVPAGQRDFALWSWWRSRLGTLHELAKLGPVPIIADALGYHPSTIERHAIDAATTYAECVAAARDQRMIS